MKYSTKYLFLIAASVLLIFSIIGCKENVEEKTETEIVTEAPFDLASVRGEIEAANNDFKTFFEAVDSVGLSNLYTKDTKLMMNGAPAILGKENVQSTFSGIMNSGITSVNLNTVEVWGTSDLITEEGEYTLYAGEDKADHGKYIVLWKNVEGKWKLHRDIFNTDVVPE